MLAVGNTALLSRGFDEDISPDEDVEPSSEVA
jgi:hypothetical protein